MNNRHVVIKLHFTSVDEFSHLAIAYSVPSAPASYFDGEASLTVRRASLPDLLIDLPMVYGIYEVQILDGDFDHTYVIS